MLELVSAERDTLRAELAQRDKDWTALMVEIAKTAGDRDDREFAELGEVEEFDPWHALRTLRAEVVAADERMAAVLDGTFSVGDGTAQREIERLRAELARVTPIVDAAKNWRPQVGECRPLPDGRACECEDCWLIRAIDDAAAKETK